MRTMLLVVACLCAVRVLCAGEPEVPVPEANKAWRLQVDKKPPGLFHTWRDGADWVNVTPPTMVAMGKAVDDPDEYGCDLCVLDKNRAWVAVISGKQVVLEFTSSAGKEWTERDGPMALESVGVCFFSDKEGYVLSTFGFMGHHKEQLYHTDDAGLHWEKRGSPPSEDTGFYMTSFKFRTPLEGWIAAAYHGAPDAPLYHTQDGGRTWALQTFEIPEDYKGGYANISAPIFYGKDKKRGLLPVKLVRHNPAPDHHAYVNYETEDGGEIWHLPIGGVHSENFDDKPIGR